MAFGHLTSVTYRKRIGNAHVFMVLGDLEKSLSRRVTETAVPHVLDVLNGKESEMVVLRVWDGAGAEGIEAVNTRTREKTAVGRTILDFTSKGRKGYEAVVIVS
ncbi:hypothetical protein MA16_Dca003342 [Dendrobium catenatum]|uniref:Uncharacterized protein n=1 Tax=Dendrobium catenatum TaxID=906689 RepID=A0A2I0XCF6_9ASPA|nr:hypothetical protein MA16_Dca003342 [Dendrobium catenatum]